jgi:hypothetical protein
VKELGRTGAICSWDLSNRLGLTLLIDLRETSADGRPPGCNLAIFLCHAWFGYGDGRDDLVVGEPWGGLGLYSILWSTDCRSWQGAGRELAHEVEKCGKKK